MSSMASAGRKGNRWISCQCPVAPLEDARAAAGRPASLCCPVAAHEAAPERRERSPGLSWPVAFVVHQTPGRRTIARDAPPGSAGSLRKSDVTTDPQTAHIF